jgi:hypothetical protein
VILCIAYFLYGHLHFAQKVMLRTVHFDLQDSIFSLAFPRDPVHICTRNVPALPPEPEPVFLNVYEAPELIPRNEFRQPMLPVR